MVSPVATGPGCTALLRTQWPHPVALHLRLSSEVNAMLHVFERPYMGMVSFYHTLSLLTANSSSVMCNDASSGCMVKPADVVAVILTSHCCFAAFFKASKRVSTRVEFARWLITNIDSCPSLLPCGFVDFDAGA